MPSNRMIACPECRTGHKAYLPGICAKCGTEEISLGTKITLPKKNDKRAWKRILNGEIKWNRRKARRRNQMDTYTTYEYEVVLVDGDYYRTQRVPGSELKRTNYGRTPDVDLGG